MSNVSKIPISNQSSDVVEKVMDFYGEFSKDSISRIDEFYTPDIEFIDPVHRLEGSLALKSYLKNMAENMKSYEMRYVDKLIADGMACLSWEMTFVHPRLNGSKPVRVRGMSLLKFTSKIYYHEDSYDLGALVYENVPVLGSLTRFLKKRMGI